MIVRFCPHCGTKIEAGFKFCPSCGVMLPQQDPEETVTDSISQMAVSHASPYSASCSTGQGSHIDLPPRSPLCTTPMKRVLFASIKEEEEKRVAESSVISKSASADQSSPLSVTSRSPLRASRCARKRPGPSRVKEKDVHSSETAPSPSPSLSPSPSPSPSPRSKAQAKGKGKRARRMSGIEPLSENEVLTDTSNKKWRLAKLLEQSDCGILYGAVLYTSGACSEDYKYILKLAAKDGKIFNEQNFLQRAAKPAAVDKWRKHHKMHFLGIPTCVGFGLHADTYRFLILPNMGVTLQSIMGENGASLSERAVFQVACRILDVLEYIHDNEYVHADIRAENVYVDPTDLKQVHLAGYCYAFRYSPSGNHVEYRELSRTPHEGAVEFLSIDSHKGAGPSRRSDLQSLGYCMLKWMCGSLPWSDQIDNPSTVMAEKERYKTDVKGLLEQGFGKRKTSAALQVYLDQVMALGYNENPNYEELRNGIKDALQKLGASAQDPIDVTLI
ncbi:inactive serine/threonine-protein kinase VRK3-like isoform X1 [Acipenser ruthenus]|uniref:inactive serine/threonine-protein kinase VRK3-like isoform X1 n=1 Tax=Acipenser ruthenus TaxID=7906 RepID=UPI002740A106|nr:inactive serine/threonine-protein kinase VRK3-like isoform X1 [Acipenser ruthenus]XP_058849851.1 inactive serine/threonine-protein kinase VRK3-like isoform X1 [Acipenser ruthenus]